jgi:hypothetical protein
VTDDHWPFRYRRNLLIFQGDCVRIEKDSRLLSGWIKCRWQLVEGNVFQIKIICGRKRLSSGLFHLLYDWRHDRPGAPFECIMLKIASKYHQSLELSPSLKVVRHSVGSHASAPSDSSRTFGGWNSSVRWNCSWQNWTRRKVATASISHIGTKSWEWQSCNISQENALRSSIITIVNARDFLSSGSEWMLMTMISSVVSSRILTCLRLQFQEL